MDVDVNLAMRCPCYRGASPCGASLRFVSRITYLLAYLLACAARRGRRGGQGKGREVRGGQPRKTGVAFTCDWLVGSLAGAWARMRMRYGSTWWAAVRDGEIRRVRERKGRWRRK